MDKKLQTSMALLLQTFKQYASADGNPNTLTKNEVKELFKTELPGFLEGGKNQCAVDKLLSSMDCDRDSEVDFTEFMCMVTGLTCAFHDCAQHK
ncbi:protein S100-P-like [Centroberyx gerrardi]|uniref:protein S100-P-like n=1 Tax=Centroberyx gerrardi TaxID=166262 RepID=UPI003AAB1420